MTGHRTDGDGPGWGKPWAVLTARLVLGLIFFQAGLWKVFQLGPLNHAQQLFVEPYAESFLPAWSLWATGAAIPVVELVAGGLVLLGLFRKPAYLALAAVLVTVTFGHLLAEPLYPFNEHVIPRLALLSFVLWTFERDRYSLDAVLGRRSRPS